MAIERELKLKITQEKRGEVINQLTAQAKALDDELVKIKKELLQIKKDHGTNSQEYVNAKQKEIDITKALKNANKELRDTDKKYAQEIRDLEKQISNERKKSAQDTGALSKFGSKFGDPGSINQIQQQVLMYKALAKSVSDGSVEQAKYIQKVREGEAIIKGFNREIRTGSRDVKLSSAQILEMGENITVLVAGLTAATSKIVTFGVESFNAGNNLSLLRKSFVGVVGREGKDAIQTLEQLQTATGNTVSELKLLQISSKGKFLDVDLGAIPELLQFATIRAKEMGVEVDYMVDSIVTGLGRKSPLILDNLGLKMDQLDKAVIKVAKSHDIHIDKVGELERQMFLTEAAVLVAREELEKSTITLDDNGFAADKLKANYEDLRNEAGILIAEGVNPLIETILESSDGMKIAGGSALYLTDLLAGMLPVIASVKVAFPGMATAGISAMTSLTTYAGALAGEFLFVYDTINMVQNAWDFLSTTRRGGNFMDELYRLGENVANDNFFNKILGIQYDFTPQNDPKNLSGDRQSLDKELNEQQQKLKDEGKNVDDLKKKYEELRKENQKGGRGGRGSKGKTEKEKTIDEIIAENIQAVKDQMELYELTYGKEGITKREGLDRIIKYHKDLGEAHKNNLPLLRETFELNQQIRKEKETDLDILNNEIYTLQEKIKTNRGLIGIQKEQTIQLQELIKKREEYLGIIQATATELEKLKPALNFDDESFKEASESLSEINARFLKALGETGADVFEDALTEGIEGALLDAFGGKADSILEKFLLKMAQNIVKTFSDLLSNAIIKFFINLFSSFIPGVGSFLGIATGGATSVPAGPSLGGLPGGDNLGLFNLPPSPVNTASGILNDLIRTSSSPSTNIVEHPYIASTRIEGSDIKLVLKRTDFVDKARGEDYE